jgi:hypothetical protein
MSNITALEELSKWISKQQKERAYTMGYLIESGEKLPEIKQLWGRYIGEGCLCLFASERGVGKSLISLNLCCAISSGVKSFLGEEIELTGNTLFVDFEMPERFIKRRAYKLSKNSPFPINTFQEKVIVISTRNSFEEEYLTIAQMLLDHNPVLMVIDNLKTALKNKNPNSTVDMANFFSILGAIREKYNVAIVVIDHLRKGTRHQKTESDLQSGSGTKTDLSDGDFFLRRSCQDKNLRILKRVKSRMFEESDETKLVRLNPETLWFELVDNSVNEAEHIGLSNLTDKDEIRDMAMDLRNQGKSYAQIAKALGKGKTTVHNMLKEKGET